MCHIGGQKSTFRNLYIYILKCLLFCRYNQCFLSFHFHRWTLVIKMERLTKWQRLESISVLRIFSA